MPKDLSFAHRIRQSNIDRQRNQAYFTTPPAVAAPTPPEPKAGVWESVKGFIGKAQAFHDKHSEAFAVLDGILIALMIWSIFGDLV